MRKKYEKEGASAPDFGGKKTVKINNCRIITETEKAWLLHRDDLSASEKFWVPKSQCHLHSHATDRRLHDLEIVRSIAEEKGLLEGTVDEAATLDEFDQFIKDRENRK